MTNATNLLNLYKTWYKDIDIEIVKWWGDSVIRVTDNRTGCQFHILSVDQITRSFKDLGNMRKACGVL